MSRKSFEQIKAQYGEVMDSLAQLAEKKAMSDLQYLTECINFIPSLAAYVTTHFPRTQNPALKLASVSQHELWLELDNGNIKLCDFESENGHSRNRKPLTFKEAAKTFELVIDQIGNSVSDFLSTANAQIKTDMDRLPTTEELKIRRNENIKKVIQDHEATIARLKKSVTE